MKTLMPLLTVLLLTSGITLQNASAQTIDLYAQDSNWSIYCSPPANVWIYGYAFTTGYISGDSLTIDIDFGDGIDTTFKTVIYQNAYSSFDLNHTYLTSGFFSVQYIATGPNGFADTLINLDEVYVGSSCGTLEGRVYWDNNGDCIFNSGDWPAQNIYIQSIANVASPFYQWAWPDNQGMYYLNAPTGITYEVAPLYLWSNYQTLCPSTGSFSNVAAPAMGLDFAIQCVPGFDLEGDIFGWGFVPGWNNSFLSIEASNNYCDTIQGILKVIISPLLSYSSATIAPTSISGDTLIWDPFTYYPLPNYNIPPLVIYTPTSQSAQIGDSICYTLIMEPINGDSVPLNNIITLCDTVRSSWDPNAKEVSPKGAIAGDQQLNYTIMFQNTGTALATNIYILDTLDTNLDVVTFNFIGSSHPCDITFVGENVLKFYFHNINLPDSGSNEPASHGFVSYSIKPKPGLDDGTLINNSAAIYFDFNPAVITNSVTNIIDNSVDIVEAAPGNDFIIYPNPANNLVTLEAYMMYSDVVLTDISGRILKSFKLNEMKTELDISQLVNGIYFIQLINGNTIQKEKLVIVR